MKKTFYGIKGTTSNVVDLDGNLTLLDLQKMGVTMVYTDNCDVRKKQESEVFSMDFFEKAAGHKKNNDNK